jgi:hypothetical protein
MIRVVHNSRDGNGRLERPKRRLKIIKIYSCLDALFFGGVKCIQLTRDTVRQRAVHNESSVFIKSKAFLEQLRDNYLPTKVPTSRS